VRFGPRFRDEPEFQQLVSAAYMQNIYSTTFVSKNALPPLMEILAPDGAWVGAEVRTTIGDLQQLLRSGPRPDVNLKLLL
jgi:hypothetical protein